MEEGPRSVCVVGAGLFGIAAARALARRRIAFDCYDRGGTATGPALRLDVSREHLQLAEWPLPASCPQLPGRRHLATYLGEYAERFGLSSRIHSGVEVRAAAALPDDDWEIELRPGGRRRFAALLVACEPDRVDEDPPVPGEFSGEQALAAGAGALRGRDVIVAGSGRESCETAVVASYVARSTRLSIRQAPCLLPQIVLGRPLDRSPGLAYLLGKGLGRGRLTARLPRRLRRWLLGRGYSAWTSAELHGLPSPAGPPGTVAAVPAAALLERLLHGRIEVRPAIERLAGDRVLFADGSDAEVDLIVWCSGARRIAFLPEAAQPGIAAQSDPHLHLFPPGTPNLAFLGSVDPVAGSPARVAEAQAELVAARLGGDYEPPAKAAAPAHQRRRGSNAGVPQVEQFEYVRNVERELRAGRRRARRRR